MATGSSLEILLLLLLILISLALAPFVLAVFWQRKAQQILEVISLRLRQLRNEARQVRLSTSYYSPSEPEPFGPLASALAKQLDDVDAQVRELYEEFSFVRERTSFPDIPNDPRILMRLPWEWYRAYRQARDLRRSVDRAGRGLEAAGGLVNKLEKQGWEVALQARQLLQDAQRANHNLEALRARNISDTSLDGWIDQAKEWERRLKNGVPVYFLSGSEEEVLAQGDRQEISEVYRLARDGRTPVDGLLGKAREWEGQVNALEKACVEITALFQQVSTEMRELENNPVRPIIWDRSRKVLTGVGQQMDTITQAKKPRTFEGVKKDLSVSLSLLEQFKAIANGSRQVSTGHQELLALLGSADIQNGLDWCRSAQKLAEATAAYDPENWPRSDGAARLRADLQALTEQQEFLTKVQESVPGRPSALRETEIEEHLISARQLAGMHADLRPRVANIQKRLTEIQAMERTSRDNLARARALLNQAESVIASNPLLAKSAPEVKSMRESLEALLAQLDQPGRGAIEAKAQRAEGLLRKAEGSANTWLAQLNADLDGKINSLQERTGRLNAIALLDDPAMTEAQRLLAMEEQDSRQDKNRKKADLPLAEAVTELKRRNDDWQRCVSVLKALESIEGSILDDYEKAESFRQEAVEQIARAAELLPETRSWPPTTQTLTSERQEFNKIEQQWKALAQERVQPIRLVSRLGSLAGEYQGLAARLSQKVERAGQEQNRLRELENRLAESKGMWQNQMQLHIDNPVTRDDIHLLLEEVEGEREAIRERYLRGSILYNQALQTVRQVCQKLDDALVQLNDTQDIDINGEIYVRQ